MRSRYCSAASRYRCSLRCSSALTATSSPDVANAAQGANTDAIALVTVGLVLSGIGLGIATPGLTALSAAASDPKDYGVTSGMRTTITQIGVTAGIQTMSIIVGTTYSGASFAASFLLGTVVAVLGTAMVLLIGPDRRPG